MNIFILFAFILLSLSAFAKEIKAKNFFMLIVNGQNEYLIDMKHKSHLAGIKKSSWLQDKYSVKVSHPEMMPLLIDYYFKKGDIAIHNIIAKGDKISTLASELGLKFNERVSSKIELWKRDVAPIEVSIKNAVDSAMALLENTMKLYPMAFGEEIVVFLFDGLSIGIERTPLGGESALYKAGAISDATWSALKIANMNVLPLIAGPWVKLIFPERTVASNGRDKIKITWF